MNLGAINRVHLLASEASSFRRASLVLPLETLGDVSPSQRVAVFA